MKTFSLIMAACLALLLATPSHASMRCTKSNTGDVTCRDGGTTWWGERLPTGIERWKSNRGDRIEITYNGHGGSVYRMKNGDKWYGKTYLNGDMTWRQHKGGGRVSSHKSGTQTTYTDANGRRITCKAHSAHTDCVKARNKAARAKPTQRANLPIFPMRPE